MKNSNFLFLAFALVISGCTTKFEGKNFAGVDADISFVEESIELGAPGQATPSSYAPQALTTTAIYLSRFELYNASTGSLVRTLTDGAVIDLAVDGAKISIRGRVGGTGGESVQFQMDGQASTFIDNSSPFSLAGNNTDGSYVSANIALGMHTLKATPYRENNALGAAGTAAQISFSVIDSSAVSAPPTSPTAPFITLASFRSDVANLAQSEADFALCGAAATNRYQAKTGSAWCSEFARWVFVKAGVMDNSVATLWKIVSWDQFKTFFSNRGQFLSPAQIAPSISDASNMVGNYLLLDTNLDGVANHSAIIVGVSADLTKIYTVEGNVGDCTKRVTRKFWVNGVLDAKISGIGKIWP